MTDWTAYADAISAMAGEAKVPNAWITECLKNQNPYVQLTKGDGKEAKSIILKAIASGIGEESTALLVAPGTFGLTNGNEVPVTAKSMSTGDYRRNWLFHTSAGYLTLFGLFFVLVGQAIQISLDLGTHWSVFDVGPAGVSLLIALKDLLTVGGAAFAAWQVVLKS